jgi:predicted helicase
VFDFGSDDDEIIDGYRRIDNINQAALARFAAAYGEQITTSDIFYYVYGLLHSTNYREIFAADLKKTQPRIPLVTDPWPFVVGGRMLAELHLNYESTPPSMLGGLDSEPIGDPYEFYRVEKMAFVKVREGGKLIADNSRIKYNARIELVGIPSDAQRYMLGSRSAVEWIIDRYQVRRDSASGIVNDPNDWSREIGNPRYILDLLARVVTVSVETMKIVEGLPPLVIRSEQ